MREGLLELRPRGRSFAGSSAERLVRELGCEEIMEDENSRPYPTYPSNLSMACEVWHPEEKEKVLRIPESRFLCAFKFWVGRSKSSTGTA